MTILSDMKNLPMQKPPTPSPTTGGTTTKIPATPKQPSQGGGASGTAKSGK